MGKQYNKVQKRRRRLAYNVRQNEAAKASRKPVRAKTAAPKAAPKKAERAEAAPAAAA